MERIGHYELRHEIARGSMGVVYRAHDAKLGRSVAIKVLRLDSTTGGEELARFRREAQAAARLDHPNIVAVHSAGVERGYLFIVMDLVEGVSLKQHLTRDGPMEPREAASSAARLAGALEVAHQEGVLHRDVKSQNVLLDRSGKPFLADFGLAKLLGRDTRVTMTGEVLGTPVTMPPEQAAGEADRIGPHSDVYSLGAVLYRMLTGRPPLVGRSVSELLARVLNEEPDPPSLHRPGIPPALEAICLKCLRKDETERYPSAAALAEDLERYLADEPVTVSTATWDKLPGTLWLRRNRRPAGLIVAGLVSLTAVSVALVWDPSGSGAVAKVRPAVSHPTRIEAPPVDGQEPELDPETRATLDNARKAYQAFKDGDEEQIELANEAIRLYAMVLDRLPPDAPKRAKVVRHLAQAYLERGKAPIKRDGDVREGEYRRAIDDLKRSLDLDPTEAREIHYRLGQAYVDLKEFAKGVKAFDKVIEIDPEWESPYSQRGQARFLLGELTGAAEDLRRAIELADPDDNDIGGYKIHLQTVEEAIRERSQR